MELMLPSPSAQEFNKFELEHVKIVQKKEHAK